MDATARLAADDPRLTPPSGVVQSAHVSIVIPIYRERGFLYESLARLVSELNRYCIPHDILLVEQFSDDATVADSRVVAAQFPTVRHLLLPRPNFGLAMRQGMLQAHGDIIVNFDIDYWDVTFVRMCLATMIPFEIDIVIGSKNARLSVDGRAVGRRVISRVFCLVLQLFFGLRVSDTHGIKAWRRSPQLFDLIRACRFNEEIFDTELVIRGERAGFRLFELPVTVSEQRKPRRSILARIPGAMQHLLSLYMVLRRESSRRSLAQGGFGDRHMTRGT
jgi:glycosyltransferase involved in cell wall biosynthesis